MSKPIQAASNNNSSNLQTLDYVIVTTPNTNESKNLGLGGE